MVDHPSRNVKNKSPRPPPPMTPFPSPTPLFSAQFPLFPSTQFDPLVISLPPSPLLTLRMVPRRENRRLGCIFRWCKLAMAGSRSFRSRKTGRSRSITAGGSVASSSTASCSCAAPRHSQARSSEARSEIAAEVAAGEKRQKAHRGGLPAGEHSTAADSSTMAQRHPRYSYLTAKA